MNCAADSVSNFGKILAGSENMIILPISELKNTGRISNLVHSSPEPVHVTRNGYDDLVLLNPEAYEEQ